MSCFKKLISVFLAVGLALLPTLTAHADKSYLQNEPIILGGYSPRIVRVGITDSPFFSQKQEDGSYTGILIDYLGEISKYAGWQLEYVEGLPDEMSDGFANGSIDLMGGMLKNDASIAIYDFAEYRSGYSYTVLNVHKDNNRYRMMDYNDFNGMRVGIYSKALNRIPAFEEFVKSNGLDITTVYYDDMAGYRQALTNGEVDAVVTNDTSVNSNQKTIAKFGAVPYYFAVRKGETELLRELNSALATILSVNPSFDDLVYEKHLNEHNTAFNLSEQEQAFISRVSSIRVASVANLKPLEYYDADTGAIEGITPDILKQISALTGLKFEFVQAKTLLEAREMLLAGEADLITGLYANAEENGGADIVFTQSYMDAQIVSIRSAAPKKTTSCVAAMPTGYTFSPLPPNSSVKYYNSMDDCIQAVITGNASFTAFNGLVIDHYTYLRGNPSVWLTPITSVADGLSFGLSRAVNPTLLVILDKAIYTLDTDVIQSIVYENTTTEGTIMPLLALIYTSPVTFVLATATLVGVLLVVILLLLLFVRTRLKLARQAVLHGESYRIIGELTDEHIFSYEFGTEELILPKAFAQMTGRQSRQTRKKIVEKQDELLETLLSAFETDQADESKTVEFLCIQPNGEERWFRAVGTVLFDSEKKPVRGLGKLMNIQAEMREKHFLENKVNTDALTGLFSRQHCERLIKEDFESGKTDGQGALMVMDLDHFKDVNDSLGHQAGDKVLRELAGLLTDIFGDDDIVGRWGGDEFIAYIRIVSGEHELLEYANRLCQAMCHDIEHQGDIHPISISIGIALTGKASTYEQLFANADAALYSVKNSRRNGFEVF